jgi:hypothetical protein
MIRYSCPSELLPTIENTLAAYGYQIEVPLQHNADGASAMVMTCGLTSVLLAQAPEHATLEIEIWGADQPIAANLLDSLPIPLHKQSAQAIAVPERA